MLRVLFVLAFVAVSCGAARAKECRTYYTDERVAIGKENVAKYAWAQALEKRILETGDTIKYYIGPTYTAADVFAAQSDAFMWLLQPTTAIPRTYDVSFRTICPICGNEVKKASVWNCWRIDPIGHPYQVQCQVCGRWFPSNKYQEGDLTSGDFPDDGNGWLHEDKRYYFLREYAHMCYGSVVVPTLTSLSHAWLLTGDPKYAHKGSLLLARVATQYPNYGWEDTDGDLEDRFERTFVGPWDGTHPHYGWKHGGMITDLIWETFCLEATAYAYDAFYDYLATDDALIAFLQGKGMPIDDAAGLRRYIEDYIFRAGMNALLKGMIKGNEGFHQAAALAVALVIDDYGDRHPNSKDMVDYAYHGIGRSAYMLINGLTRDGGGHESPNYNSIKCDFIRVAQLMEEIRRRHPERFSVEEYPDIFADPKAKGLFDYYMDILVLDTFLPSIGDCGGIRAPSRYEDTDRRYSFLTTPNLYAFGRYGDPRYARASTRPNGDLHGGWLWEPYPSDALEEALDKPESVIARKSRLLDGYGVAILESGDAPHARAATLNYASIIGHRQNDHLAIGLYAHGLDFLPDLGYPKTWDYRAQWDACGLAHNTVTVDETAPVYRSFRNAARLFASVNGVHVVTAHHNPYPERMGLGSKGAGPVDLYERTLILVDVDEARFYAVDLFAVNGGEQHDQSWHAMLVAPRAPELDWQVQEHGTLAGPEVPEFGAYTDPWGRRHGKGGFPSYLTAIRRAPLDRPATWTWESGLPEGDTLRLHIVPIGGAAEVIMGRGRSPVWPPDERLDYLLVRRHVEGGAASHFLTVLDAFQGSPAVQGVRVIAENPLQIEVARADGVDAITIHLPEGVSRSTAHRPVGVRVCSRSTGTAPSEQDGASPGSQERDVRIGALGEGSGPGYAHATILDLDYDARQIVIGAAPERATDFAPGRAVRIYNDMRSALFRVVDAKTEGDRFRVTLDKTALMARFPVSAADAGRLQLAVKSPFITGHVNKKTGALIDGPNDYYYGCWMGEREAARLVAGISNTKPAWLHLAGNAEKSVLAKEYAGKVVSLWHYGIGDSVEVARIEG